MKAKKYRKKPVVVEAMRLEANDESVIALSGWMLGHTFAEFHVSGMKRPFGIAITTLEGTMIAFPGDFIIRGVQGEFYPCKPDIFEATYEEVE